LEITRLGHNDMGIHANFEDGATAILILGSMPNLLGGGVLDHLTVFGPDAGPEKEVFIAADETVYRIGFDYCAANTVVYKEELSREESQEFLKIYKAYFSECA
jgi:hypothetical protein